jgi:hypothetical protein
MLRRGLNLGRRFAVVDDGKPIVVATGPTSVVVALQEAAPNTQEDGTRVNNKHQFEQKPQKGFDHLGNPVCCCAV